MAAYEDDVLAIQRALVDRERAKQMAKANMLKRDIRGQIARSGQYNPDSDPQYVFHEYPKAVRLPNGTTATAFNKAEENFMIKHVDEPPKEVTVDIANLAQPEAPREKRKYTKKASVELPANLD